jgi:hypothetical protein
VEDIAFNLTKQRDVIKRDVNAEFKQIMKSLGSKLDVNRKDFAAKAVASPNKKYLFLLFDGNSIDEAIWNTIKPSGVETIKVIPESVA